MSHIVIPLAIDLVITILVEMIVSLCLGVRSLSDQLLILGINGVTNPILHILFCLISEHPAIISRSAPMMTIAGILIILEIMVILVEYLFLRRNLTSPVNPLKLSLMMNAASCAVGFLVDYLI